MQGLLQSKVNMTRAHVDINGTQLQYEINKSASQWGIEHIKMN